MRKLVINPLGEVLVDDALVLGSINVTDFRRRLGREPKKGDFTREFNRLAKMELRPDEYEVYRKHSAVGKFQTDLVRFYVAQGKLLMSIEFIAFVDNKIAWRAIKAFAKRNHMTMETMTEDKHLDRWSEDNGKTWHTGKNHGRMERQVEICTDVMHMELPAIKMLAKAVATEAMKTLNPYLVSVI